MSVSVMVPREPPAPKEEPKKNSNRDDIDKMVEEEMN